MKMNLKHWILFGTALLAGLVATAAFIVARPYQMRGSEINPAAPAPEITLPSAAGEDFQLSSQQGRLVMLFFGYTSCPDVCPVTLAEMKQIKARLKEQAGDVRFVYVTVDPDRDTPERLQRYLAAFDPTFIGLTAPQQDLEPVWKAYGVYRAIQPGQSAAGYLVDHTARTYLVDRRGRLRLTYAFGTPVEDVVEDMRFLLKEP